MITELEKKELKSIFQGHYTEDVLKVLNNKSILNRNGEPHNAQYIRMVFQGVRQNSDIEAAIWQVAINKKQELELQKLQKQKVLTKNS
ncbi:hypothetical protein [Polaribacter porphyrae]|uniref:Uncharacterized protein n=1 Tax=Polaribacter porphyrae TaxID=1137780 RepID=A0A2S7WT16_9FLAO|nr:hypothetical protein [Polaribacter porphyrae]PQJ80596.1 hypothetical protein BTO18_16055 [Polaribacter porphyrae]